MDLEKIAGIVKILEESSLKTLTLKEGDFKLSLSKLDNAPVIAGGPAVAPPPMHMMGMVPPAVPGAGAPEVAAAEEESEEELYITSPIVGTFYSAPAPDAPAFVKVGDHVKNGQTVCILEAMKLMNEIQAEYDCEIDAVLVSNEQKVEYGQPLFRIKKV